MAFSFETEPYDPCPCGSGQKYKFCCAAKAKSNRHGKYPIGTVIYYGPDDKTTTKIAAGVVLREGCEPILNRWIGTDIADDPDTAQDIKRFFAAHGVKSVAVSDGIMGCPHEEGIDFPVGQECPFCPFWAGKQGIVLRDASHEPQLPEFEDEDEDEFEEDGDEEFDACGASDDLSPGHETPDWDGAFARIQAILGDSELDFDAAVDVVFGHLQANLKLPCKVTGIEDFQWEEPYVIGGWSQSEYRRLKKSQPSYTDRYELLSIGRGEWSEWMMFGTQDIAAHVRRIKDGKEFVLGLTELKPTDRHSAEYQLLRDYEIWFVNRRLWGKTPDSPPP